MLDKESGLLLSGNFGDWLAVFKMDNALASSSFFVRNLNVAAATARAIGLESDADKYEALAQSIGQAFVNQWWDAKTQRFRTSQGYQPALAIPLFAGICGSVVNISEACGQALVNITIQGECSGMHVHDSVPACLHAMHVTGGIMGAEALLPALSMAGRSDIALAVALQNDFPSWAAMTHDGSGTLWERWDGDLRDAEGSSRNHVMLSSVRTWAGVAVAGLSALAPAWSSVLIAPDWRIVHSDLNNISSSSCSVFAPAGTISTSWAASPPGGTGGKIIRLVISLPPGVTGVACVPCLDCSAAVITESATMVWNGSSGYVAGVAGIRSAKLQQAALLVNWALVYPGAAALDRAGTTANMATCFEIDSGDYAFESDQ